MEYTPDKTICNMLSERELETLKLVTLGLTNKEIAREMCITHHTVKAHIRSIFKKIGGVRRSDIAIRALIFKLVELTPKEIISFKNKDLK